MFRRQNDKGCRLGYCIREPSRTLHTVLELVKSVGDDDGESRFGDTRRGV